MALEVGAPSRKAQNQCDVFSGAKDLLLAGIGGCFFWGRFGSLLARWKGGGDWERREGHVRTAVQGGGMEIRLTRSGGWHLISQLPLS